MSTTIRKINRVFAMGLMTITGFVMLESLRFVVDNIVAKNICGIYSRVVINRGRAVRPGKGNGSKGNNGDNGLKDKYWHFNIIDIVGH